MSSSLSITKHLTNDNQWEILAEVVAGTLPRDIFIYENLGEINLGMYIGVTDLAEYQRLKTFEGTIIPKFGNRFVKYTQAKIKLDIDVDPQIVIGHITDSVKAFSLALSTSSSTTLIINIP